LGINVNALLLDSDHAECQIDLLTIYTVDTLTVVYILRFDFKKMPSKLRFRPRLTQSWKRKWDSSFWSCISVSYLVLQNAVAIAGNVCEKILKRETTWLKSLKKRLWQWCFD